MVSANEGPNARVSDLAAKILNQAADAEESKYECISTEALQAKVEALNKKLVDEAYLSELSPEEKVMIGSLDFKAYFPSMKVEIVVPVIRKRLEKSPATIIVKELELARFLFVMMDQESISAEGLEDVLHTQKDPSEKKPRLIDSEMVGGDDFRTGEKSKLNPPVRKPTVVETKKMIAIAVSLIVKQVMTNFLYTFGGKDKKQDSGGPIGDVLTQAMARHIGNGFDELFNTKMASLEIKTLLYERYADDIDLALRSIGRRTKFCLLSGRMVSKTEEEIETEVQTSEDELNMIELKKIADSLMKHIETEYDCPSLHPELDNKVPVLDLSMWVEEVPLPAQGMDCQDQVLHSTCKEMDGPCLPLGRPPPGGRLEDQTIPTNRMVEQIQFEFFSKPMAPSRVMLSSSAQPWGQKRTTLTQELIRRLLNCRKELGCKSKRKHLNRYMQLLHNSGYNVNFRTEILKSGINGYIKILAAEREGRRPMYRPKNWEVDSRRMDKQNKKKNWLGPYWKSCIFVPPTPGSELKKRMRKREEELRAEGRLKWPIKIIETAGKTLEQTLVNTDPFNGNFCNDKKCLPSKNPKNKISCRKNSICYRITCLLCIQLGRKGEISTAYFGESGKNMHCRMKEHLSKFNSKKEKIRSESAFFKHL